MKKTLIALMLAAIAGSASAAPCPATAFDAWVDVSGSMMLAQENAKNADGSKDKVAKIAKAKKFLKAAGETNNGEVESGIFTVSPYTVQAEAEKRSAEDYAKLVDEKLPEDMETVGRMSWLGERAKAKLEASSSVTLITDGAFSAWKEKDRVAAKEAFAAFRAKGGKLTVLSLAGNDKEKERLAEVFGDTEVIDLNEALQTEDGTKALAEKVLDRKCPKADPVPPPPAPVKVAKNYELVADALFDFDKYGRKDLNPEGVVKLDNLIAELKKFATLERIDVKAYTDRLGTDAYNDRLSKRRAATIFKYLTDGGLPAEKITAVGMGERDQIVPCRDKKLKGQALRDCLHPNRRVVIHVEGSRFEE